MSKKRQEVNISASTFKNEIKSFRDTMIFMDDSLKKLESDYCVEIAKIKANYALFNEDFYKSYSLHEANFSAAINYIQNEYHQLSESILKDLQENESIVRQQFIEEEKNFTDAIDKFTLLQKQAYEQYLEMCRLSDEYIDREFQVHSQFVREEDDRFSSMVKDYSTINNKQYDKLLWSMEKSKNALNDLANQLNESTFNDAKFLTQSVIKTIENLRSSKNEITSLFKLTTQHLSDKKKTIDNLSLVRQKPHSVLNQKLINQFVQQIHSVNDQRLAFEKLVKEDLSVSIKTIGPKIIDADKRNETKLTKKLIMQYQIIQSKADFLLKRNKEMSDLLIQKYQNEIKKIKVDSFRRVEEIKLTYFIPSEYFQNSINLYSNFAFYINESLDEIDNSLSDFIHFNQTLSQTENDYVYTSTKVFEDYKLNLLVTVNDVTTKLSEQITEIDRLSKEIIELESKNRLEIAQIRKDLENLDITADYQKYLKSLAVDREMIDFQHQMNQSKLAASSTKQEGLLTIQSDINETNQNYEFDQINNKYRSQVGELEKQIKDAWNDHQFMLAKTSHQYRLEQIQLVAQKDRHIADINSKRSWYQIAKTIEQQELQYKKTQADGNAFVVDYIDQTQSLIDLYRKQTDRAKHYMILDNHPYRQARWLEKERENLNAYLDNKVNQDTESNRKAVTFLSHYLFNTRNHLINRLNHYQYIYKKLLVDLNLETAIIQSKALETVDFYLYEWSRLFDQTSETLHSVEESCHIPTTYRLITKQMELYIYNYSSIVKLTKKRLSRSSGQRRFDALQQGYIQIIELSRDYLKTIYDFFEKALEKAIEYDVIAIREKRIAQFKEQAIINSHYDQQILHSLKRKPKWTRVHKELDEAYAEFELRMKDQVYNLNQSFLTSLNKEREKLDFIIEELVRYGLMNQELKIQNQASFEQSVLDKIRKADLDFTEIESHYKAQKTAIYGERIQEMQYLENQLLLSEQDRQARLDELSKQIAQLPTTEQYQQDTLEQQKTTLLDEKRKNLQVELSRIEELKLSSIPVYLDQIELIKNRLPNDYLTLYKEISAAESQLINEHKTIENLYQQNFGQFLSNQSEYTRLLFNDSVLLYPFDKKIDDSSSLIKKSQDVLKDTIDKTQATQDNIHKRSVESKEKQKRVLNV